MQSTEIHFCGDDKHAKMIEYLQNIGGGQRPRGNVFLRGHCHRGFVLRESDPRCGQDPRELPVREKRADREAKRLRTRGHQQLGATSLLRASRGRSEFLCFHRRFPAAVESRDSRRGILDRSHGDRHFVVAQEIRRQGSTDGIRRSRARLIGERDAGGRHVLGGFARLQALRDRTVLSGTGERQDLLGVSRQAGTGLAEYLASQPRRRLVSSSRQFHRVFSHDAGPSGPAVVAVLRGRAALVHLGATGVLSGRTSSAAVHRRTCRERVHLVVEQRTRQRPRSGYLQD